MVAKVLRNTEVPIKALSMIYKVVFQAVLLYGSEMLEVAYLIMMVLEGFQNRISR